MKNKPIRHKDLNTFKFQPFAERISNIDIDIFHRVGHENETDDESRECYFYQAVEKWSILNLTQGFEDFKKDVRPQTLITLPQLVLNKEHVVEALLKHLKKKNVLALQPLLDIVVATAKDLHKDFYQYYQSFFEVLIELLETKDTEQLEWVFSCLAYLFKFLWRPLLKDITGVFNLLLPLLSDSRPAYIHSFASGSFAYVARKVKDWPSFLYHVLKTLKTNKDSIEGCGKLFFEVIHGVNGHFHSCAQTVLPFLLSSLGTAKLPQKILFEVLTQVFDNILANIHPQKNEVLWSSLLASIKHFSDEKLPNELELVLKLLGQSVEHKQGRYIQNLQQVISTIVDVLSLKDSPENVLQTATKIVIVLLLGKNVKLTQEQASSLTRKVLSLPQVLLYFVDNITDFAAFEMLVLPTFLTHCIQTNLNNESLKVLTRLIVKKAPLCANGIKLPTWAKYSVDFHGKNLDMESIFLDHLNALNFDNYLASLVCLPHLSLSQTERITLILTNKISEFLLKIEIEKEKETEMHQVLFLLNMTIECLIHLNQVDYLDQKFDIFVDALAPLVCKNYLNALNTIDLLVSVLNDRPVVNLSTLRKLNENISSGFISPYHEMRLVTAHVYTFFENLPEFDLKHSSSEDVPKEKFRVFSICYNTESIDPQVHTYRHQLQNLEKLNFDKPQMIMCNQTEFKTIPLRYLCGALYINFKLLWEPVSKIIETHAHGLEVGEFWEIFGQQLRFAVGAVRNGDEKTQDVVSTEWDFIRELYENTGRFSAVPDFGNYRLLLWKALDLFADIAEAKTRDVAELFLDFIEVEHTKGNSSAATKWNIKKNSEDPNPVDDEENEPTQNIKKKTAKKTLQLLPIYLSIFSKTRSPKSMYREPELAKLYFDLLQNKNSNIQKLALDCIMTYKHKYLTPYKDHLYNLIDDKNFKNEVSTFRIDKESGVVQDEHRDDLIPLIMRIVFSKMSTKTGLRTGGKSSGQVRRNLVFRFLAGCEEKEMLTFTKMALQYYSKFLNEDPEVMINSLNQVISLDNFVPPKRLQSTLNLLNVIIDQFGGLMGSDLLKYLLKVLLLIGGILKVAFDDLENVHSGYWPILRNLRTSGIKLIERFFNQFDRYLWTSKEINTIFNVFVWPYVSKLNTEGIHSPTSLLKLFFQWSCNPRYFSLLVKHNEKHEHVLPQIIQLLLNPKSKVSVTNMIEEMIEKLLTLQADEEDLQLVIPVDNLLPVAKNILDRVKLDDKLNYGSCILLPFVPSLLEKIQTQLEKTKTLNRKELFILSRISELVWENDICNSTLKLLLPQVLKRCSAGEETVCQILTTVSNLIKNVENPRDHFKQLIPLFGEVNYASGRKLLIQVFSTFGTKMELSLVEGLNAFDKKWIDQPDFQRRHDTFKDAQKAVTNQEVELELGVLLIYNCYYLLKNEKDLAMRENASQLIKDLSSYLINKYPKSLSYILDETVFTLIRNGMKTSNDFRNECILILGHLSRECPDKHPIFRDLNYYTSKTDPEVDFFENITHLQLHRHSRALLKFCNVTKDLTVSPNVRTLTQFVLPLASFYLCNEKYVGKNSVIDASVECIGTICKILPWHQYESLLKFYLEKLQKSVDYQKQLVRVTVAILDAFHFDLSKAQSEAEKGFDVKASEEAAKGAETNGDEERTDDIEEQRDEEELLLDEVEDGDEDAEANEEVKICEKVRVLCKSTAVRVTRSIQVVLLPALHKSLAELTQHESSHKVNRKKTSYEREEEDLLRVPISLALVKLLQRLPVEILNANLPGIFMKLCTFLKSHLESVRRVTRETLQKIMTTLGPNYLNLLLGEMTPLLSRGFHVHVLVYTVHSVLACLKQSLKPTDIDKVLLTVLQLCQADLFGSLSEEKEVAKIAVKTSEAKSTKSFDTMQILAQYITDKCLLDLILPIKNVLQSSHSHKTVSKAQECLRHIALGLADNSFVQIQSLLIFAYGTSSESIPELVPAEKQPTERKLKEAKVDCFIIPKAPVGRSARAANIKTSQKTNAHVLVEFGLRLCHIMLKRDKLKDEEYSTYLDPFVNVFVNCLNSKHIKLSALTLQCLAWVLKRDLPTLKEKITVITESMFGILHKFGSAGLSKGDNFDLVMAAFKAMAVLVRDVKYHTIDTDQLKILLLYAEQDMHDHDKQATAFNLLKAIIARKLIIPEIHEVMVKLAELSITSELKHVRLQSRIVFHQYLMDYPLGDKLEKHVSFYLSQMSYEMQYGRESAIEMIGTLISTFPMKPLKTYSGTFFVTLGARLVNDEIPECRKQVSACLSSLLGRLERKDRDPLFDIAMLWLRDKKLSHRQMAAQLLGIFVTVEKSSFESRLAKLLPAVLKQFNLKEETDEESQRIKDHTLFQVVNMLLKVCANCPGFFKMEQDELSRNVQKLLAYPHDWVRLAACQYLGFVLGALQIEQLASAITDGKCEESGYLRKEPLQELKALTLDLCDQLQPGVTKSDLAEQVIKNLVFVARVLEGVPAGARINLLWLTKRMRKIVNCEVVESAGSTVLRTEVFKWIAALSTVLKAESLTPILGHLLAPLVREMITTEESNAPLRQLSKEVGTLLKNQVGLETYTKTLSNLQRILSTRRAERKRHRTQLAVTEPEVFAQKKIKRQEKKKEAKKRKLEKMKGRRSFKKRKVMDLDPESEVM